MSGSFIESRASELNEKQLEAVKQVDGPLLVLAGAGSGKTRVLTYRIAHLIYDHKVPLHNILAMTFSNKAAREMHDRVKALLGDETEVRLPWVTTFHSACARILRMYGDRLGFGADYVIYDTSEQLTMIRRCFEHLNISKKVSPEAVHSQINKWKNDAITPEKAPDYSSSSFERKAAEVYQEYAKEMLKAQAMDFDDLLFYTYKLFKENSDIKERFQNQWKYVLIDEFQDTNKIQNKLINEVLNPNQNICVVGDDDQSIYGWRGAKIENILNFDKTLQNCKVVKLEQNYRSTGNILKAAASIISKNELRHDKTLWTEEGDGLRIRTAALSDDRGEARFVVGEIKKLIGEGKNPDEIAVFYRINALSRGFEEECLRQRLPYRIIGGFRFYERREIKDVLSYLKLLLNPSDFISFRRTVNTPLRGIGKATVEKLEGLSVFDEKPIGTWISETVPLPVKGKAAKGILVYRDYLKWGYEALKNNESLVDLFSETLQRTKYLEALESKPMLENQDRIDNIQELLSAVQEFEEIWAPQDDMTEGTTELKQKLRDFLERVSLMADVDGMVDDKGQVTFMSLHAAKGLEFNICFLSGMEEGLFPSSRSFDSYERTEEERRLCYVGFTRAKKRLYLTRAASRRTFGQINFAVPSRFLKDLPTSILETYVDEAGADDGFDNYQYGSSWGYQNKSKAFAQKRKKAVNEDPWADFDFDQTPQEVSGFSKGDHVVHPSFGEGIVQRTEMIGGDECLNIVFINRGVKKVLSKFVNKRD